MLQVPLAGPSHEGLPSRVAHAAIGPADFLPFATTQLRLFIHHFSGQAKFCLGGAVAEAAKARGPAAQHPSVDQERDSEDLDAPQPYGDHLELALKGSVHA